MPSIPGITTDNYSPVLKEQYPNPVISRMMTKLRKNVRPLRSKRLRTGLQARSRIRKPREF